MAFFSVFVLPLTAAIWHALHNIWQVLIFWARGQDQIHFSFQYKCFDNSDIQTKALSFSSPSSSTTLMIANVCPPSVRYLRTMIWLKTQVQHMGVKQGTNYPVCNVQSHLTLPNQKQYISRWYSSNLPRNLRAWQWIQCGAKESRRKKERVIVVFQLGWEFAHKRFKTKYWAK